MRAHFLPGAALPPPLRQQPVCPLFKRAKLHSSCSGVTAGARLIAGGLHWWPAALLPVGLRCARPLLRRTAVGLPAGRRGGCGGAGSSVARGTAASSSKHTRACRHSAVPQHKHATTLAQLPPLTLCSVAARPLLRASPQVRLLHQRPPAAAGLDSDRPGAAGGLAWGPRFWGVVTSNAGAGRRASTLNIDRRTVL